MTKLETEMEIENAFNLIESKFKERKNETGLEILANMRAGFDDFGTLTPGQKEWIQTQADGDWRKTYKKPEAIDDGIPMPTHDEADNTNIVALSRQKVEKQPSVNLSDQAMSELLDLLEDGMEKLLAVHTVLKELKRKAS